MITIKSERLFKSLFLSVSLLVLCFLSSCTSDYVSCHNNQINDLDIVTRVKALNEELMANKPLSRIEDETVMTLQEDIVNSPEFLAACKITTGSIGDNETTITNSTVDIVRKLFVQMLENYCVKSNDVSYVISRYVDIIDQSTELTDDDKNQLKMALATALYSSNYWESRME